MKIFITSTIPEEILDSLKNFDLKYHDSNEPLSKKELMEGVKDADVLFCPLSDKIDKDILSAADHLKLVANYGAGYDNIDIKAAKNLGIKVTNAPAPSSAVSTAELTFSILLTLARKTNAGEISLRNGDFRGWRPTYFLGHQLKGKTLGIIGLGNIGSNLAKRALAFEMDVIYYSRNRKPDMESLGVRYVSFDEVIKNSDFLSLHTAFAPELYHMIGENEFKQMKKSAFFINAARGPLVDEKALAIALKNGEIQGAGLDVYEFEPRVTEELLNLENTVLLPHLGNATYEARLEMGRHAVNNILALDENKELPNQVN